MNALVKTMKSLKQKKYRILLWSPDSLIRSSCMPSFKRSAYGRGRLGPCCSSWSIHARIFAFSRFVLFPINSRVWEYPFTSSKYNTSHYLGLFMMILLYIITGVKASANCIWDICESLFVFPRGQAHSRRTTHAAAPCPHAITVSPPVMSASHVVLRLSSATTLKWLPSGGEIVGGHGGQCVGR